jgi:hypothetical protein
LSTGGDSEGLDAVVARRSSACWAESRLRAVDDELLTGVGWEIEGLVVEGEVADDGWWTLAPVRWTLTWWVA